MQWYAKPDPAPNQIRIVKCFAWTPTLCGDVYVFWEDYYKVEKYKQEYDDFPDGILVWGWHQIEPKMTQSQFEKSSYFKYYERLTR